MGASLGRSCFSNRRDTYTYIHTCIISAQGPIGRRSDLPDQNFWCSQLYWSAIGYKYQGRIWRRKILVIRVVYVRKHRPQLALRASVRWLAMFDGLLAQVARKCPMDRSAFLSPPRVRRVQAELAPKQGRAVMPSTRDRLWVASRIL